MAWRDESPVPDGAFDAPRAPRGPAWSAIVLTGGASTRMGIRKDVLEVDGVAIVARLLRDLPDVPVVVVGLPLPAESNLTARDDTTRSQPLLVTREQPPGGGPVAGIAAGLRHVTTPAVAICAGDMPYAGPLIAELAERYLAPREHAADRVGDEPSRHVAPGPAETSEPVDRAGEGPPRTADPGWGQRFEWSRFEALVPQDSGGHPQPLCAVYRTAALRRAVDSLGDPAGRSMRQVLARLDVRTAPAADQAALLDVDTPADLETARSLAVAAAGQATIMAARDEAGGAMKQWVDAVKQELGLDIDVDVASILDVAKDAAHSVQRPAAPVTTYLLGYAVASGIEPGEAAGLIRRLANDWAAPE